MLAWSHALSSEEQGNGKGGLRCGKEQSSCHLWSHLSALSGLTETPGHAAGQPVGYRGGVHDPLFSTIPRDSAWILALSMSSCPAPCMAQWVSVLPCAPSRPDCHQLDSEVLGRSSPQCSTLYSGATVKYKHAQSQRSESGDRKSGIRFTQLWMQMKSATALRLGRNQSVSGSAQ